MKVAPQHPAGTLEFVSPSRRATLSRAAKSGRAIRLAPGVFVLDPALPPEQVAFHHRFAIIAHFWPGAVLCDASALAGGEPVGGWLFICHPDPPRSADLRLPGLTISARVGAGPLPGDMPMPNGLSLSGPARTLVENVPLGGPQPKTRPPRAAGVEAAEDRIDEDARSGGAGRIRQDLAQLDTIAAHLPSKSVELIRARLASVLGTFGHAGSTPVSPRLRARLANQPYDEHRIELFRNFADMLQERAPVPRFAFGPPNRWQWQPFFEAYFSNFIEGTEFGVEEARRIAIDGVEPADRPEDAHDISATYRIAADPELSRVAPGSGAELVETVRGLHELLMATRPKANPGVFKTVQNYAGGYAFVAPELTVGTLLRGFDCFHDVSDPFQRACALMLLVTECHPFNDGNGRTARLIANGSLTAAGQARIVIPTVYRNNYLAGLSAASNGVGRGEALLDVLGYAQRWTTVIDWEGFDVADAQMHETHAYLDASNAERTGRQLRLPRA